MDVTAYFAVLLVFIGVAAWCFVTRTMNVRHVLVLVALTAAQALFAARIDYWLGVGIAAVFLGVEVFALFEELTI